MKAKDFFRYAAKPFNIFIALSILIFIIIFFEMIFIETARTFGLEDTSCLKPQGRAWDISRSEKRFMPNGRVLLVDKDYYTDRNTEKIYDSNYTKLWEGQKKDRPPEYDYLTWAEAKYRRYLNEMQKITPEMSKALEIPVRQDSKIREIWRYQPREDNFIGYEFKNGIIGYIGANGFGKSQTDIQPFGRFMTLNGTVPPDSENPVLLWQTDNRLFTVDFENRKTEILIDTGNKKISKIAFKEFPFSHKNSTPKKNEKEYRPMIEYRTDDDNINLILYQPDEKILLKLPQQWKKYFGNNIRTVATKDAIFVYHSTGDILKPESFDRSRKEREEFLKTGVFEKAVNYSAELYKVDKEGNPDLINKFTWVKPEYISPKKQDPREYATVVSPPVFWLFNEIIESLPPDIFKDYQNTMAGNYLFVLMEIYPRKLTVNLALSILMMLIALLHGWARRKNEIWLVFWLIFVGMFNLAGLLTYLALNHTPLIKCPLCGKWRGLERTNCIRCGAEFPVPSSLPIINLPIT